MTSLGDRIAIVTGAGRGIGTAIARRLCETGAHVAIADVDERAAAAAADSLRTSGYRASAHSVDVRMAEQLRRLIDDLLARHGRIDILVNNAGIPSAGPAEDVSEQDWNDVLAVNLTGMMLGCQAAGRVMIRQGGGRIVNICSIAAGGGWPTRLAYAVSKAGCVTLTRTLAAEWARFGVRVNAVSPGHIDTSMTDGLYATGMASRAAFERGAPMRRMGTPAEIAEAVLFLAGPEAESVTGEVLTVDGGWSASGARGVGDLSFGLL
jgi:NAD(P)-dependent dehydrogenase (short-subunit alcohol dehydrogenase family)